MLETSRRQGLSAPSGCRPCPVGRDSQWRTGCGRKEDEERCLRWCGEDWPVLDYGRPANVRMMQATDFGNRDDRAQSRRLDSPSGVSCRARDECGPGDSTRVAGRMRAVAFAKTRT